MGYMYITTSSKGNGFRVTGPFDGNLPFTGGFPSQKASNKGFDDFFDVSQKTLDK